MQDIPQDDLIDYKTQVSNFNIYQLDEVVFINELQNAPLRSESTSSDVIIDLPYGKNKFEVFEMFKVQTLSPQLASSYPSIQSYVGQGRGQNPDRVRITITPMGVYAKIYSNKGSVYINPMTKNGTYYKVFNIENAIFPEMQCDFEEQVENQVQSNSSAMDSAANLIVDDSTLRTFRLAVATTAEYSQFHINQAGLNNGTDAQKKAAVLAAIVVSVDRVNGIIENDLSTTLQLIPNNDTVIFLDPATDPYTDASANPSNGTLLNQNNGFLPGALGVSNFDIGHVLTTLGGGVASVGSACNNNFKAAGVSGSPNPVGDGLDLTFAHEIGHQLGAFHTFNNSCGGNRSDNSVYETGSGVTVMAYGSTGCQPNVQGFDFDYYHVASIIQIFNTIENSCAQTTTIANSPPSITPLSNHTIPKSTPFLLEANATDADNDNLTYNWEQVDNQISTQPPLATSTNGPNFRNFQPTTSNFRYFPQIETLLNNQLQSTWEVLPSVSRNLLFNVIVRDNNINGGQNVTGLSNLSVEDAAGPFAVTSQNTPDINWLPGETRTITWDVAGTTGNGINTANVDILLSTDGGFTYDTILASNTLNDGTHDITVPNLQFPFCRIMVKAVDNVYFALNENMFAIDTNVTNVCDNYSNSTSQNIPDGNGTPNSPSAGTPVFSTITIPDDIQNITDINININATHNSVDEILFQLQNFGSDFSNLWIGNCSGQATIDVTFNDFGAMLPNPGSTSCGNPITGIYSPFDTSTSIADIFASGTQGNFSLAIVDFVSGNTGTLNSWEIEICSTTFSVEDNQQSRFSISPNPNNGRFNLNFTHHIDLNSEITLYNIQGRIIETLDFNPDLLTQQIQLKNQYQSGVYLIEVANGEGKYVQKLVIK